MAILRQHRALNKVARETATLAAVFGAELERVGDRIAQTVATAQAWERAGALLANLIAMTVPPSMERRDLVCRSADVAARLIEFAHDTAPPGGPPLPWAPGTVVMVSIRPLLLHAMAPAQRHAVLSLPLDAWLDRGTLLAHGVAIGPVEGPCRGANRRRRRALTRLVVEDHAR